MLPHPCIIEYVRLGQNIAIYNKKQAGTEQYRAHSHPHLYKPVDEFTKNLSPDLLEYN